MGDASQCPKCGTPREVQGRGAIHEIDVAHHGETWDQAEQFIILGLRTAIEMRCKALRVIHGYGASSGVSVIAPRAISLMRHLAETHDARFAKDQSNPGVSLIWLNKGRSKKLANEVYFKHESLSSSKSPSENWFDLAQQKKH